MPLPKAVAAAARAPKHGSGPGLPANRNVSRGDLRLIKPPYEAKGDARLGLVLNVDSTKHFIEFAMVHTYAELATSLDGIVPAALARTPYDIVVQTDLRGVAWTAVQVSGLVGELSSDTVEEISDLIEESRAEAPSGVRIGTPLAGTHDRRWAFKVTEGDVLDALTSDCASEIVDGQSPWSVDPVLIDPQLLASSTNVDAIAIELAHWLETRTLRLTVEDALHLEECGALELDSWRRAALSEKLYEALLDIVEETLTRASSVTERAPDRFVVAPYSPPSARKGAESVYVIGTLVGSAS